MTSNQQHPITPPPELVQQWWDDFHGAFYEFEAITTKVFQAGADQELEACCKWLEAYDYDEVGRQLAEVMHAARRPKPPSLKEQALERLDQIHANAYSMGMGFDPSIIRRALEQLND